MDLLLHFSGGLLLGVGAAISPGPDTFLVLRSSAAGGTSAGLRATLGICAGLLVHAAITTLLIVTAQEVGSAPLLKVVQVSGVVYLAYLGLGLLRTAAVRGQGNEEPNWAALPGQSRFFCQGFLTNLTNPKALVFFASVVSPFIAAGNAGNAAAVVLGVVAVVPVWYSALSVFSGRLMATFTARHRQRIDVVVGGLFLAVAAYGLAVCWAA
jgi:threonine/homoserine/homoserine lactone efflux protein